MSFFCILSLAVIFNYGHAIKIVINQAPEYYTPLNSVVYLSGSFNNFDLDNINFKMERFNFDKFKIDIQLPIGLHEFRFTRGTYDSSEVTIDGKEVTRTLEITEANANDEIEFVIGNWRDMIGDKTASGNVYILHEKFPYPQMRTTKILYIYLPPDYHTSEKEYPVFYFHDGRFLFDQFLGPELSPEWAIDETMEKFYSEGKQTAIIVAIDTFYERYIELTPFREPAFQGGMGDKYIDFLLNNVKPYVDKNFRTLKDREHTGVAGSSLGGLISAYLGVTADNVFSMIGCLSPSLWVDTEIYHMVNNTKEFYPDTKFYFAAGNDEGSWFIRDAVLMMDLLKERGNTDVEASFDYDGVHENSYWREVVPKMFDFFLKHINLK